MPLATRSLLLDVASSGTTVVAVGERGHVLASIDGGASWRQLAVPTQTTLTAVTLVDPGTIWVVGHGGLILSSRDGGRGWRRHNLGPDEERALLDVWFAGPQLGVAIGAHGLLATTADGGETWRMVTFDDEEPHANAIAASPDGTLYVVGEFGLILRSDDRGVSWRRLASPYEGSLFGVLVLGPGTVLVFGLRGHVFRSDDRGETWQPVASGTNATLLGGLERGDGSVALTGLGGALLLSRDRGRSFQPQTVDGSQGGAALAELSPSDVLMVGEDGLHRITLPVALEPALEAHRTLR